MYEGFCAAYVLLTLECGILGNSMTFLDFVGPSSAAQSRQNDEEKKNF